MRYRNGNKKMLNMMILEILQEYSDSEHRLTQAEIIRLLKLKSGMECDRRSVRNNIECLEAYGYDIVHENGYYLATREFEEAELRMLIDSVLFSKNISTNQAQELIEKLKSHGNKYFDVKVSHVCNLSQLRHADNKQIMFSLEILNDAISQKKKVSFTYNEYEKDFKLHPNGRGTYIVNPYQLVANNGRYYLIGNYDKYNDISHYRIDRMSDVAILEENAKPLRQIKGMENGFALPKHMAEHIYMYSGESAQIKMKVKKCLLNELIDWFGKDFRIAEELEEDYLIRLKCNEKAMRFWALQYGEYVEVLEPVSLRNQIKDTIQKMQEKYDK